MPLDNNKHIEGDEITEATPNPKLSLDNVWLANLVYWYMYRSPSR